MSARESSFVTGGVSFDFPAGCPLVSLLETTDRECLPELRGCDSNHSRAPLF